MGLIGLGFLAKMLVFAEALGLAFSLCPYWFPCLPGFMNCLEGHWSSLDFLIGTLGLCKGFEISVSLLLLLMFSSAGSSFAQMRERESLCGTLDPIWIC